MHVQPYLTFHGRCDEALEFYKAAVGAKVEMRMLFKESPDQTMIKPELGDKVMHASLRIGDTMVFATDGGCEGEPGGFHGFSLTATVADDAEADAVYAALTADGGKAHMPPAKTFWSSKFGMGQDKFGVNWMVMVGQ